MVNTVIHIRPLDQLNKKSLIAKTLNGVCESSQKKIQLIREKAIWKTVMIRNFEKEIFEYYNRIHWVIGGHHNHFPTLTYNLHHYDHFAFDDLTIAAGSNQPCSTHLNVKDIGYESSKLQRQQRC